MTSTSAKRVGEIDTIKGLGIIAVVMSHAYFPFSGLFTLFIIVIFFMASGFFWNEKHTHTWRDTGALILKRFRDLFLPYLIVKIVFALLRNVFVALHLLPAATALGLEDIPGLAYTIITCGKLGDNPALSSYFSITLWFLALLFFVYVVHALICRLFDGLIGGGKRRTVLYIILIAVITVLLWLFTDIVFNAWLARFLACYAAFLFGTIARMIYERIDTERIPAYIWVLIFIVSYGSLITIYALTGLGIDVAKGVLNGVLFYYGCGLLGFVSHFAFAVLIGRCKKERLARGLGYIGKNTKPIMTMHIIFFKPIVLLYILVFSLPVEQLETFPVIMDASILFMWILYVPFGITMSLLIDKPYRVLKNKFVGLKFIQTRKRSTR